MKYFLFLLLFFISKNSIGQKIDSSQLAHRANFDILFDKNTLGKEGYHLNGYIVIISEKKAKKLHGKTIRISGMVTKSEGIKNQRKVYDSNGKEIIVAGRPEDAEFILTPKITVLN